MAAAGSQRIDKWLWFARLAKTRTAAQQLAVSGRVRLNGEKTHLASRAVKPGDVLTIVMTRGVKVLRVVEPGTRRGPAVEAQALFEDLSPPPPSPSLPRPVAAAQRPAGSGRPTKRQRRELDRFRAGIADPGEDFSGGGE